VVEEPERGVNSARDYLCRITFDRRGRPFGK
jgi:hypothetical protein